MVTATKTKSATKSKADDVVVPVVFPPLEQLKSGDMLTIVSAIAVAIGCTFGKQRRGSFVALRRPAVWSKSDEKRALDLVVRSCVQAGLSMNSATYIVSTSKAATAVEFKSAHASVTKQQNVAGVPIDADGPTAYTDPKPGVVGNAPYKRIRTECGNAATMVLQLVPSDLEKLGGNGGKRTARGPAATAEQLAALLK